MSLQWHLSERMPEDTQQLGQRLLRERNVYRQVGEHFGELFPRDEEFASMYQPIGRGAEPPLLMALVTVFQMMERVPDRLAAEWVVSRIDWKYGLHLPLAYAGFHFTDLLAFRNRLKEHQQERLLFDRLIERLNEAGLIQRRGKIRTDSTHILGVVEKLGRMELVSESVRLVIHAVQKADPGWAESHLPVSFLENYTSRESEYGLSDAQVRAKLLRAGEDGSWLLHRIEPSGPPALQQLAEVEVLRQVLRQQFPRGPSAPGEQRPSGQEVIESPHEAEVRFGKKRSTQWKGYKIQASETCDEGYPHLWVDLTPSQASGHDSQELPAIQQRLKTRGVEPAEQYADQAYLSAENIYTSRQNAIELLGKPLADTHPQAPFRQDQFRIQEPAQQAICPAGVTSTRWSETRHAHWPASRVTIHFPAALCNACPFFNQCTRSPHGRTLELHPFRAVLAERRKLAQQEAYLTQLRLRAGIEAGISQLVRMHRLRYCRYRGMAKLRLQAAFTAVAANLHRLALWWSLHPQFQGAPSPSS